MVLEDPSLLADEARSEEEDLISCRRVRDAIRAFVETYRELYNNISTLHPSKF